MGKVTETFVQMRRVQRHLDDMRLRLRDTPDDPRLLQAIRLTAGQLIDFEADHARALRERDAYAATRTVEFDYFTGESIKE